MPALMGLHIRLAVDEYDLSSVKVLFSGAAPLGHSLVRQVKERLLARRGGRGELGITQGGCCFLLPSLPCILIPGRVAGYGLTETSPTTHLLTVGEADRKMGSIGILLPNLEARLVEDDAGAVDAEEGKPGELWVRGRTVMKVGWVHLLFAEELIATRRDTSTTPRRLPTRSRPTGGSRRGTWRSATGRGTIISSVRPASLHSFSPPPRRSLMRVGVLQIDARN